MWVHDIMNIFYYMDNERFGQIVSGESRLSWAELLAYQS